MLVREVWSPCEKIGVRGLDRRAGVREGGGSWEVGEGNEDEDEEEKEEEEQGNGRRTAGVKAGVKQEECKRMLRCYIFASRNSHAAHEDHDHIYPTRHSSDSLSTLLPL